MAPKNNLGVRALYVGLMGAAFVLPGIAGITYNHIRSMPSSEQSLTSNLERIRSLEKKIGTVLACRLNSTYHHQYSSELQEVPPLVDEYVSLLSQPQVKQELQVYEERDKDENSKVGLLVCSYSSLGVGILLGLIALGGYFPSTMRKQE